MASASARELAGILSDRGRVFCVHSSDHRAIVSLGLEFSHDVRNLSSEATRTWAGAGIFCGLVEAS